MGIPHLTAAVEHLAKEETFKDKKVIIDGPALAFHILNQCKINGIQNPSPQLLNELAFTWLTEIEKTGSKILAIYFDGFLPTFKVEERMTRMMKSHADVVALHTTRLGGCSRRYLDTSAEEDKTVDLFSHALLTARGRIPRVIPPFVVPNFLEALNNSRFTDVTKVVRCEADVFCAQHALNVGGVVLTSDSDLLIHDVGEGSVAFLRSIRRTSSTRLVAQFYKTKEILQKFKAPEYVDSLRLGYEVYVAKNKHVLATLKNCSPSPKNPADYKKFRDKYTYAGLRVPPTDQFNFPIDTTKMDPRISEMVLLMSQQYFQGTLAGYEADCRMFLPILIENTCRGSAWSISAFVRIMAYSILNMICSSSGTIEIYEHRRVQFQDQQGVRLCLFGRNHVSWEAQRLLRYMDTATNIDGHFWMTLCIILDVATHEEMENKKSLILAILRDTPPDVNIEPIPWDIVHMTAQIQGFLYSLRILKQVLSSLSTQSWAHIPPEVDDLYQKLGHLPGIDSFPNVEEVLLYLSRGRELNVLELLETISPMEEQERIPSPRSIPIVPVTGQSHNLTRTRQITDLTARPAGSRFRILQDEV